MTVVARILNPGLSDPKEQVPIHPEPAGSPSTACLRGAERSRGHVGQWQEGVALGCLLGGHPLSPVPNPG